jgi:hypothetical protein
VSFLLLQSSSCRVNCENQEEIKMAKPSDKITITMTRSEWNKYISGMTSHDVEKRNSTAIKFEKENKLS